MAETAKEIIKRLGTLAAFSGHEAFISANIEEKRIRVSVRCKDQY